MAPEAEAGRAELRRSPVRHGLFAVLSLGFAVVSFIAALSTPGAWFGVVFFGAGAVVLALSCLPPFSSLVLTRTGFTPRSLVRRTETPWSEVTAFGLGRQPGRGAAVTIVFRTGDERILADTYGMAADDLAALLERWRAAYGR